MIFIYPTGLAIVAIFSAVRSDENRLSLNDFKDTNNYIVFSTAALSISIATSIGATFLITVRIMKAQRSTARAFPGRQAENRYNGTIEIVAESAVLYSMSLLVLIIFIVTKNSNVYYPQNIHAQISVSDSTSREYFDAKKSLNTPGIGTSAHRTSCCSWLFEARVRMEQYSSQNNNRFEELADYWHSNCGSHHDN